MRRTFALALLAMLVAACAASQPGKPAPTVLGTQQPPGQATEAPMPHY
jgi:hypothetical protein